MTEKLVGPWRAARGCSGSRKAVRLPPGPQQRDGKREPGDLAPAVALGLFGALDSQVSGALLACVLPFHPNRTPAGRRRGRAAAAVGWEWAGPAGSGHQGWASDVQG